MESAQATDLGRSASKWKQRTLRRITQTASRHSDRRPLSCRLDFRNNTTLLVSEPDHVCRESFTRALVFGSSAVTKSHSESRARSVQAKAGSRDSGIGISRSIKFRSRKTFPLERLDGFTNGVTPANASASWVLASHFDASLDKRPGCASYHGRQRIERPRKWNQVCDGG
jgi:hypothetical protein